jgi:hypothetical protein
LHRKQQGYVLLKLSQIAHADYLLGKGSQSSQEQIIGYHLDVGRPYSDCSGGDAQGVAVEDGENMDDDAGAGNVCQVSPATDAGIPGKSILNYSAGSCFTKAAYQISETEAHMKKSEIKQGVYRVITVAVKFHGHAFGTSNHSWLALDPLMTVPSTGAQTQIMQNLTYFEHLAEPMAELLNILEKEFDHTILTEEILR